MTERVRAHVNIVVGCLHPLDETDRKHVLVEAAHELGLVCTVSGPQDSFIISMAPMRLAETDTDQHERLAFDASDILSEPIAQADLDSIEDVDSDDEGLEQEIEEKREKLAELEREHKERIKNEKSTPEELLESSLQISNLRTELRDLEGK